MSPTIPSYKEMITWSGTCFHGEEILLDVGKQATSVAVNGKFSLIAVGTRRLVYFLYIHDCIVCDWGGII